MILSEYKDIIKFAMENEVEAQKFYEEAAKKIENTQLKEMFAEFGGHGKGTQTQNGDRLRRYRLSGGLVACP